MNPTIDIAAAYAEVTRRLARDFVPASPDDLVGPARELAIHIQKLVRLAKENNNAPLKLFLPGNPGLGKSLLAAYVQHLLGCSKWDVIKLNGTQVKVEKLEEIEASLHLKTLFGDWRLLRIEEADTIPTVAQVRFLTILDDLPSGAAVVCTSNCKLKELEARFQSRFQVLEVEPPQPHEIETFLSRFLTDKVHVNQIATFACGNVRQALLDAQSALQAAA